MMSTTSVQEARLRPAARQRGDQGRKSGVMCRVGIRADLEQSADERQRPVVDRVLEAGPMASGIGPFGTQSGSSTAARSAARSPRQTAESIFLNCSYSAPRSASDFIVLRTRPSLPDAAGSSV